MLLVEFQAYLDSRRTVSLEAWFDTYRLYTATYLFLGVCCFTGYLGSVPLGHFFK